MDNYYLTKEDINKNVLVSDFLISTGSTFFGQDNNIRQFLMFPDGRDNPYLIAFVNMDRNEWVCTNPEMGGKVTDLAEKVFSLPIDAKFMANALRVVQIMDDMPRPSAFKLDPSDKVQVPVDVGVIDEDKILIPLFCMGISKKVAYDYLRQGTYKGIKEAGVSWARKAFRLSARRWIPSGFVYSTPLSTSLPCSRSEAQSAWKCSLTTTAT